MKQVCSNGVWNETVPGIQFDADGVSNYYHLQRILEEHFPRGEKGLQIWEGIVNDIKEKGKNDRYDCVIGVRGGVDSSYLLHIAKNIYGLRPLAVNLDNGWSTDIAVKNIQKITKKLNIDLETYVINYEEIKDLLRSYMRASLPWIDTPTDMAIKGALYKVANRENIKVILRGNDFRSEGKQPREWTYSDYRQLKFIHRKFGNGVKLKTFPFLGNLNLIYYGYIKKIKEIRPYYYVDYQKEQAKELLVNRYDWQDYGGHHHENIFTKFAMSYWLPLKFGIDKRLISLSAQVVSGAITRNQASDLLQKPFETAGKMEDTRQYVLKKLDITTAEFDKIWSSDNKSFLDYPNNFTTIQKLLKYGRPIISRIYKQKPMSFFEMEIRDKGKLPETNTGAQ